MGNYLTTSAPDVNNEGMEFYIVTIAGPPIDYKAVASFLGQRSEIKQYVNNVGYILKPHSIEKLQEIRQQPWIRGISTIGSEEDLRRAMMYLK